MNVLLVTESRRLSRELSILSPDLEYCAIVVDEVESAKKILEQFGLPQCLLHPMNELKPCAEGLDYDYIFCLQKDFYDLKYVNQIRKWDVLKDKVLHFGGLFSNANFKTEQLLRYCREHSQDFEMFATGISGPAKGIDVTQFKRRLIKLAKASQDLYYDFQVAKFAILCGGGGIVVSVML
ncbi:MAG: hypothetical protein J5497_01615 [Selenomonadaceae bacterium]|nr:hypothetical protein [Selenomonadaceae bacterium]